VITFTCLGAAFSKCN